MPEFDNSERKCPPEFLQSSTGFLAALNTTLLDAHKLHLFEVRLLDVLDKSADGQVGMSDLAEALMLPPSRITGQIGRLEAQGLVSQSAGLNDRPGVLASITPQGRRQVKPAVRTYADEIRMHSLNPGR